MKYILVLFCILSTSFLIAQEEKDFIIPDEGVKSIIKFAPRIISPKIGYEKLLYNDNSVGFELKMKFGILSMGAKLEPNFRHYFKEAPFSPYIQVYGSGGYGINLLSSFEQYIQAGGGLVFGGQYNIGNKKAIIDVFGGIQYIHPFFLSYNYNNQYTNMYSDQLNFYTTMSPPVVLGIRFGFFTLKKPTNLPTP